MLIFLDTEFTDLLNCELISIGMVSEDGNHQFYSERSDFQMSWCNSFVQAAVLPKLGKAGPAVDQEELAKRLSSWFSTLPNSVTIACDNYTDWELLLDALNGIRPVNLDGHFDLRELSNSVIYQNGVADYHKVNGQWHHALHDAYANRHGWCAWKRDHDKSQQ